MYLEIFGFVALSDSLVTNALLNLIPNLYFFYQVVDMQLNIEMSELFETY